MIVDSGNLTYLSMCENVRQQTNNDCGKHQDWRGRSHRLLTTSELVFFLHAVTVNGLIPETLPFNASPPFKLVELAATRSRHYNSSMHATGFRYYFSLPNWTEAQANIVKKFRTSDKRMDRWWCWLTSRSGGGITGILEDHDGDAVQWSGSEGNSSKSPVMTFLWMNLRRKVHRTHCAHVSCCIF